MGITKSSQGELREVSLRLSNHLPQQPSVFSTVLQVKKLCGKPKYRFQSFARECESRKTILKIFSSFHYFARMKFEQQLLC